MSEWQPIETAPVDGSLILICGFGTKGYFVADAKFDGEWMMFDQWDDSYSAPCLQCSHWMPLPEPPQR